MDPLAHSDRPNGLEEWLKRIPAFRGYFEREHRRDSDKLARTYFADQLRAARGTLDQVLRRLADEGKFDALSEIERARTALDALELRVIGAPRGYGAFFEYVKMDRQRLDDVLLLDLDLGKQAEAIREHAKKFTSQENALSQIIELQQEIDQLSIAFDKRRSILAGLTD